MENPPKISCLRRRRITRIFWFDVEIMAHFTTLYLHNHSTQAHTHTHVSALRTFLITCRLSGPLLRGSFQLCPRYLSIADDDNGDYYYFRNV